MATQQPDRVRQYLRRRGCAPSVVKGGLEGLISHWESAVAAVGEGYDLTLPDYRTDVELREVLSGALEIAPFDQRAKADRRMEKSDATFRELTVECGPVVGDDVVREHGLDSAVQWWYFRRPGRPAPDFEEELREAGLV